MPAHCSRYLAIAFALTTFPLTLHAADLHFKKNVSVGGTIVSNSEIWVKGARERGVNNSPTGNTITLRQCDLNRTVTINEKTQSYLVVSDPQDEAAMKAAALLNGTPASTATDGTITQTTSIIDTGERKQLSGFTARHLKTTVTVESSAKACSQASQKYEIDGWYADIASEQTACQAFLPPIHQSNGCHDRTISRRKGTAKAGYPLSETIVLHNADATTTKIVINTTRLPEQVLDTALFDVPLGYREAGSIAELNGDQLINAPTVAQSNLPGQPTSSFAPAMTSQFNGESPAMGQPMGMNGTQNSGSIPLPQAFGPKAPGRIRIGIAPADAQMGQGNNAQADYGTPIRNSIVFLMSGPAVEIAALDSRLPMQVKAEAQQKQCDYVLFASVTVKHGGGNFGKFMKMGSMAANVTPVGMMAHGMSSVMAAQAAGAAAQVAAMSAQQQAVNQLTAFNGQIKSKDNVTIGYQLMPAGQDTPRLQNSLNGKAKSDGEDVLTPLIQQAANTILTEVTKK